MSAPLFQPFPMVKGHRAQVWRHQPSFRRPRHFHPEPEFNIVLGGQARMGVGSSEVPMGPGDVLYLRPGQDHVLLDASPDLELFVLAATPDLADQWFGGAIPTSGARLRLSDQELVVERERLLSFDSLSCESDKQRLVASVFLLSRAPNADGNSIARRALGRLYHSPHESAGALARALGVDAGDLSRHFASDLGLHFVQVRARLRLMRFIEAVDAGAPLTRASAQAHFGSYAQCHRVFRHYLGCAPKEYFARERDHIAAQLFLGGNASRESVSLAD